MSAPPYRNMLFWLALLIVALIVIGCGQAPPGYTPSREPPPERSLEQWQDLYSHSENRA